MEILTPQTRCGPVCNRRATDAEKAYVHSCPSGLPCCRLLRRLYVDAAWRRTRPRTQMAQMGNTYAHRPPPPSFPFEVLIYIQGEGIANWPFFYAMNMCEEIHSKFILSTLMRFCHESVMNLSWFWNIFHLLMSNIHTGIIGFCDRYADSQPCLNREFFWEMNISRQLADLLDPRVRWRQDSEVRDCEIALFKPSRCWFNPISNAHLRAVSTSTGQLPNYWRDILDKNNNDITSFLIYQTTAGHMIHYSVPQQDLGIGCLFEFMPKLFRWPVASFLNPSFPPRICSWQAVADQHWYVILTFHSIPDYLM